MAESTAVSSTSVGSPVSALSLTTKSVISPSMFPRVSAAAKSAVNATFASKKSFFRPPRDE